MPYARPPPHRRTGRRPGGEHVRLAVVEPLTGPRVDHHRFGLPAGGEVDQGDDHRTQGTAAFGEDVLVADRVGPVRAAFQQAVGDQGLIGRLGIAS
ncbi:hypothetical protein MTP02_58110 [Streptomyces albus]|nr:hypothetical protein MTP02_58110 [Streptomyces albus]